MKACSKCGESKPATAEFFYRQKNGNLFNGCKACDSEYKKKLAKDNKVSIAAQRKQFRADNKVRIAADKKKDYENNKEVINFKLREITRLKKESIVIPNTKVCIKCGKELPRDLIHFWKHKKGLKGKCKECMGSSYGVHVLNKPGNDDDGYKFCTTCKERLPNELFNMDGNRLSSRCKKCEAKRNRRYYVAHADEIRAKSRIGSSERHKVYYSTHQLEYKAGLRRRRKSNPDLYNSYIQKRLALKRNLPATLSVEEWRKCKLHFNNECAYCGKPHKRPTQEHFIPISKGGNYGRDNIIPACLSCNPSKNDKDFFYWYPLQDFYSPQREQRILKYLGYKNGIQQLSIL